MKANGRLRRRFADVKTERRAALVTFVTAGDPNPELSSEILYRLPASGADIIELGIPFSDPVADGPAIQASSQRALARGASLARTLEMVRRFRDHEADCPIVLMGYFNPIYSYGAEQFLIDAEAAGVDGLIVVDLPPEEDELVPSLDKSQLDFIYLAAPTTDDDRLPTVLAHASGYVYYVSIAGITGTRAPETKDVEAAVARIRQHTDLPIAVGFGIRTPEQAAAIGAFADGVVVGSALVSQVADNVDSDGSPNKNCANAVISTVEQLAARLRY